MFKYKFFVVCDNCSKKMKYIATDDVGDIRLQCPDCGIEVQLCREEEVEVN